MKNPAEARATLRKLEHQHPGADTELRYANAFELLVATILSAQTTDVGVNEVTPALFARYPDARQLADADPAELEELIRKTGFFRQKTRALIGMSRGLVHAHGGNVPPSMDALVKLPGVGRKTANVVLGHALGVPGLPVDRHVLRVSGRLGLAGSEDPEEVERELGDLFPPREWTLVSDTLILHGRRVCKPKPLCDRCTVSEDCDFFRGAAARARATKARGKTAAGSKRPSGSRAPRR